MKSLFRWFWKHSPVVLGIVVSGTLLFLALKDVHPVEVAHAFYQARMVWLIPMGGVLGADLIIRALRWRILLPAAGPPAPSGDSRSAPRAPGEKYAPSATVEDIQPLPAAGSTPLPEEPRATVGRLMRLEAIGLAINNVVFLRIGELARAYLAGVELNIPTITSLATIFVERALDMTALTLLFGLTAARYPDIVAPVLWRPALLIAAASAVVLLALSRADRFLLLGPIVRLKHGAPKIHEFLEQAIAGSRALKGWATAFQLIMLSLSLWTVDAGLYWAGGRAMRLDPQLDYGRSVLVLSAAAASSFLPAVPGAFGTFEQAIKVFLMHLHYSGSVSFGYAGFIHIFNYLIITALGIAFLYQAGHTLGSLKSIGGRAGS